MLSLSWMPVETPDELFPLLRTLAEEYPLVEGMGGDLVVRFLPVETAGVCEVTRQGGTATVQYQTPAQAARGVGLLLADLVADGATRCEALPFTSFGIMLDCSRNAVMTVTHFKRWLRRLSLLGFNQAMLYTEDTYQLSDEPYFGYLRGAYTAEELREIDAYAAALGVEMVPCIQTLAHQSQILRWPAYSAIKDTTTVMLVGEERTYALIDKMLAFWKDVYRTRRIHIGMDEAWDLGRGKFLDKHGFVREFDVFNQHLDRVVKLCQQHGQAPMIWSDMYFAMGSPSGQYYDKATKIPDDVREAIPAGVDLVYWDYYHAEEEFYLDWIARHRALGKEPVMGSGVWTWGLPWHDKYKTIAHAGACIRACRQAGLQEIFFTLWGDDGAYCEFDSALSGLAWVAELAYTGETDDAALEARFQAVCGTAFATQWQAAEMNNGDGRKLWIPGVLWDDPLLMLYANAEAEEALAQDSAHLRALAEGLAPHRADRAAGDINHAWLLTTFAATKVDLLMRLREGYAQGDRAALQAVRAEIPAMTDLLRDLVASFTAQWHRRNKPFGLEVLQNRFGGQLLRWEELARRLDAYLAGAIDTIAELDANQPAPTGDKHLWGYGSIATAMTGH